MPKTVRFFLQTDLFFQEKVNYNIENAQFEKIQKLWLSKGGLSQKVLMHLSCVLNTQTFYFPEHNL